jgi:putative peptidoglycan lipid II flippase
VPDRAGPADGADGGGAGDARGSRADGTPVRDGTAASNAVTRRSLAGTRDEDGQIRADDDVLVHGTAGVGSAAAVPRDEDIGIPTGAVRIVPAQSDVARADAAQVGAGRSGSSQPDTVQPDRPGTAQPDTVQPDTVQPDTAKPGTAQPETVPGARGEVVAPSTMRDRRSALRAVWHRVASVHPVAHAAALIAAVTVLARAFGFVRTLVFSHTVGTDRLADAYNSANQIPNTVFDIVAGGALAGVAVPLLAGPLARGERRDAERIVSALLTWAVAILLPLSAVGIALARPLGVLITGDGAGTEYAQTVSRFLLLFLPQVPLYGVAVVLAAAMQADRRFFAPALTPLLSSLVVVTTYLLFGSLDPRAAGNLSGLGPGPELLLGLGTTLGVGTLVIGLLPAVHRSGLRPRPALRFPPGAAGRARGLAAAGIATLAAQNVAVLGVVLLTNHAHVEVGSLTVYNFSWSVYVLPYAVLAVPIATSAFTDLAARADAGDRAGYRAGAALTSRAVLVASCFGAAQLVAVAWPMARLFIPHPAAHAAGSGAAPAMMAYGLLAFAPGLPGYAAIAHLGRVLYAAGHGWDAAIGTIAGWLAVLGADAATIRIFPSTQAVAALGAGNAVGMTVAGLLLAASVRRRVGPGVFAGLPRAAGAAALATGCAGGVGWLLARAIGPTGAVGAIGIGTLCALVASMAFAALILVLDPADVRPLLTWWPGRARVAAWLQGRHGDGA